MKYCTRCMYPDTKPDLFFNDAGVCSACQAFDKRAQINWRDREISFEKLCADVKKSKCEYDCVVPVSGGKDSHYQTLKALEHGLNPLAVTATTDHLSSIGRSNLDNISNLGVDLIEVTTNTKVRRKINAHTLREVGDISWAEHCTIFTIPITIALKFGIPLIIWGENPQNEYGGPKRSQEAAKLDNRWLQEFGGLNGMRVSDLVDAGIITRQDSKLYTYPELKNTNIGGVFLGHFFPWDGATNALIACQNGFKTWHGQVEGTGYDYENLDNLQTGIHDYFKYLKFGFGRCTDLVSNHIRRKNITRSEGKEIISMFDGKYPASYLGVPLADILDRIDMDIDEFITICNKFANKELFECDKGRVPRPKFRQGLRDA